MQDRFPRWRAVLAAAAIAAVLPASAGAATQAEIDQAVADGAAWLEARQAADGSIAGFGGDWAAISLSAAGVHAADVQGGPATRSLQDHWQATYADPAWGALPNGNSGGALGKAILIARAGGIDPARVGPSVSLVASLAGRYDAAAGSFGSAAVNGDGFAALALADQPGVPPALIRRVVKGTRAAQFADGGWSWSATPGATTDDVDMTALGLTVLCRAEGADGSDPQVQAGLAWLQARQLPDGSFETGPYVQAGNAVSNAWALSGLNACGVDAQGPAWTTASGDNVVDYLLGLQAADGGFELVAGSGSDTNATESAVRALAGEAFSAEPPARSNPADTVWRPVAPPAAGTPVPVALAIEDGASAPRLCAVTVPDGTPLAQVLETARNASVPAGCVDEVGAAGGVVTSLNGLGAAGTWEARVDGASVGAPGGQEIGFGDTVWLSYRAAPVPPAPGGGGGAAAPVTPAPATPDPPAAPAPPAPAPVQDEPSTAPPAQAEAPVARIVRVRRLAVDRRGRVALRIRCPEPGEGARSCTGRLRVVMRVGGTRVRAVRSVAVRPGASRSVRVKLRGRQLRKLQRRGSARAKVVLLVDGRRHGKAMKVRVRAR